MMRVIWLFIFTSAMTTIEGETENDYNIEDSLVGDGTNEIENMDSKDNKAKQLLRSLSSYVNNNSDKMAQLISNVDSLLKKMTECDTKVASLTQDLEALKNSDLFKWGRWCGYQNSWYTIGTSTINYATIFYSDSNMDISGVPLDIRTGILITGNIIHYKKTLAAYSYSPNY